MLERKMLMFIIVDTFHPPLISCPIPSLPLEVNNNNIRLIRRCQNATCYNDMDRTVKKHEMTEVLDC